VSAAALALAGFVLGAIVGSFLATLCLRWPEGQSVVHGRSACDGCRRSLQAWELIPLISAGVSGGKARCCGHQIDPLHGQVEWAAALIGGVSLLLGGIWAGAALALFGWLLLPLAVLDARHLWLPDRLTLLLAAGGLALGELLSGHDLVTRLMTGLAAGGALALIAYAYKRLRGREGLGSGDPKLFAAVGLWLGPELTVATLLAATLIGLGEALLRRRAMDEAQPFGTLLAIGAWSAAAAALLR
jgi:leader peptidase (prepilin peptidase)/N-methyltransferase